MFYLDYRRLSDGSCSFDRSVTERCVPSSLVLSADGHSLYLGEQFDGTDEQFFARDWQHDPEILNSGCSALCIASFDQDHCAFAADTSGRELLYYYYTDDRFILSDSFWGVLQRLKPSIDDLDIEVLQEMIAMGGGSPCDHATPVKHLFWLPANHIARFAADAWDFTIRRFADIRRSGEVTSMDDAVEGMDRSLQLMGHLLADRHAGQTFALGLSGGLDSRIALHYLQEAGIEPRCFNVSTRRPHGVLLAANLRRSRELAAAAGVQCHEVAWKPASIRSKTDLMLKNQPIGTGGHYTNVYKYEQEGMPAFDVLVGAGQAIGPMLVGVSVPAGLEAMDAQGIYDFMMHLAIGEVRAYPYTNNSIRRQLDEFGMHGVDLKHGPHYQTWQQIATDATYERIYGKIKAYVDGCLNRGYRPSDITLDYRTVALGPTGRNGAYESRLGTAKSYTIYTPFLIHEALKWDEPIVRDRAVLKALIARKIPEFAQIGEETFGSTDARQSAVRLLGQKIAFAVRGSGIMTDEWYARNHYIHEAFLQDMDSTCEWFKELFPVAQDSQVFWKMSPARMNAVWEAKRLVDCIETGAYLSFEE